MANTVLGADACLYNATRGDLVSTGALTSETWYQVSQVAATGSVFTNLAVGSIFKSPTSATMTLGTGDAVVPLTLEEVCRTECDFNMEQDVVDATTSCDFPYAVNIPTGITTISGSMTTMLRYDDTTKALTPVTIELMNKFLSILSDNNDGTFAVVPAENSSMILVIDLNRKITSGSSIFKTYLIVLAFISSFNMSLGLGDPVAPSADWTKGEGQATLYVRELKAS